MWLLPTQTNSKKPTTYAKSAKPRRNSSQIRLGLPVSAIFLPKIQHNYPQSPQDTNLIYQPFLKKTSSPPIYPHYPQMHSQFTKLIPQCFNRHHEIVHISPTLSTFVWIRYGDKWKSPRQNRINGLSSNGIIFNTQYNLLY